MPRADNETFVETNEDTANTYRWILKCAECPELNAHRIAHIGVAEAAPAYRVVRTHPSGSFLLATTAGEGQVMLDGRWQRVTPGSLVMAPPRVLNAFHTRPGKPWHFCYVRYAEPSFVRAMVGSDSPVRAPAGGEELARAIGGLRQEWAGPKDPKMVHHWVSLIQGLVQRAARPAGSDDRLAALWEIVRGDLSYPWTLEELAVRMHSGIEFLRRRCQMEMGRSPMQHVAYMRMQRAQVLLETSNNTLEVIAQDVGYSDGLVFSRAFKRWIGMNPRDYRAKR